MNDSEIGLEKSVIEKIVSIFRLYPEIDKAIVYGSRAKGNFKPFSDIDITLVGKKLHLTIQQKIKNHLDDLLLPYQFDLSIFHQIENQDLINHIERVGRDIYNSH